jgi:hypothetical protein
MPNLRIFLFFFIAAPAGTLLHECGHALVALLFGFHPVVHYDWCSTISASDWQMVEDGTKNYNEYPHRFWITAGGPAQTLITGFTGMAALLVLSRRTVINAWNGTHLLWIVLAYFHSRWVYNSLGILYKLYVSGKHSNADEVKLMRYWNIDIAAGTWAMLLVACALLAYITFVLVKKNRWQLIVFGGAGSLAGGWFWLKWAGPVLMP